MIPFTGLNALTGAPEIPLDEDALFQAIKNERAGRKARQKKEDNRALNLKHDRDEGKLGPIAGVDPLKLDSAQWGLLYPQGLDPAIRQALEPLIQHRNGRGFEVPLSQRDDPDAFRLSLGETRGNIDPKNLPYYLLIAGPPDASGLSFSFQQRLSDLRPVGRIDFPDPQGYADYAARLIEAETGQAKARPRQAVLFSPALDDATRQSSIYLAGELKKYLDATPVQPPGGTAALVRNTHLDGAGASLAALENTLQDPPALLFAASHGLSFPYSPQQDEPATQRQRQTQGALVCAEWDRATLPVPLQACLSGDSIDTRFDLRGLLVIAFACYGAGVPAASRFAAYAPGLPTQLAKRDFTSRLPQRLLQRGALGFVGHIDKSWGYSYIEPGIGADIKPFSSLVHHLFAGVPLGQAFLLSMIEAYLDLHLRLTEEGGLFSKWDEGKGGKKAILAAWLARADARATVVLGDPAVRLL